MHGLNKRENTYEDLGTPTVSKLILLYLERQLFSYQDYKRINTN